jgi:hypothetical protein
MRQSTPPTAAATRPGGRLALGAILGLVLATVAAPRAVHAQDACEDVSGEWSVEVAFAPPQQVTVTLEQSECEITGFVRGNNETAIENGVVEGATFTFDTTVTNEATGESLVISWEGTVEGDDVTGSLTTQMIPVADFMGSRSGG